MANQRDDPNYLGVSINLPYRPEPEIIAYGETVLPVDYEPGGLAMLRPTIFLGLGAAALVVVLAMNDEASAQSSDTHRRSTGNLNPTPPRRSMGNFPSGQPNYYSSHGRQSSASRGHTSGGRTIVVPNRYYPGWYYPAVPAYPVPVYPPYGRGHVYVPAPGYYPYYYRPGYVVPRYPYAF